MVSADVYGVIFTSQCSISYASRVAVISFSYLLNYFPTKTFLTEASLL